MTACPRRS